MDKKLDIPADHYVTAFDIQKDHLKVSLEPRKKIAMVMISLGEKYWPYLAQCINDCKERFLPNHKVDYFIWTDFNTKTVKENLDYWKDLPPRFEKAEDKQPIINEALLAFREMYRNKSVFNTKLCQEQMNQLNAQGIFLKQGRMDEPIELEFRCPQEEAIKKLCDMALIIILDCYQVISKALKKQTIIETETTEWPMPTLMRYHLFLHEEEKLKDYDYIYYLDADMRVVQTIPEEIFTEGLMCAPHPGYVLNPKFIPPYEPNKDSQAYIHRLHTFMDDNGKPRLIPFYAAGGFQGGNAIEFIRAMKEVRSNIDKDFNNNYTAIWNDESHWNKYLWEFQKNNGTIKFLDVSYIMPDSLIKEYYEPLWGRSYEPKIISLTKPWTLILLQGPEYLSKCPTCGDNFTQPRIQKVITCGGRGKEHRILQQL